MLRVWCVFDTGYAPGPCPLLYIGSSYASAELFIAHADEHDKTLWLIDEWIVDSE